MGIITTKISIVTMPLIQAGWGGGKRGNEAVLAGQKRLKKRFFKQIKSVSFRFATPLYGVLCPYCAHAASLDKADSTWGPLTKFVLNLFTGDPAIIASLVAFLMGIALAMRTQHKMAALGGGLAVALAFQLGPNLVEHLSGGVI